MKVVHGSCFHASVRYVSVFESRTMARMLLRATVSLAGYRRVRVVCIERADDLADRKLEFLSEVEVALIVRRHSHDGARAIAAKDVVRHVYRPPALSKAG